MVIKVVINTYLTNSVYVKNSQQRTTVRNAEVGSRNPVMLVSDSRLVVYS